MRKGKILIVDDSPKNLQLLGKTLANKGYEVLATKEANTVLDTAIEANVDIILLDIMMPHIDGFGLCEQLKAEEITRHIPVIFITARNEQESINKGFHAGGVDYITKPFNKKELLCRVETHLNLKLSKDENIRQREELRSAVDFKNKIFSVIGHDLRTPINGISGALEMLVGVTESTEEFNSIKEITKLSYMSSVEMGAMLEDLLNWGQLESGTFNTHLQSFNASELLNATEKFNSYQLSQKNIKMVRVCDESINIYSDRRVVGTIIRNLESNAIKFSKAGSEIYTFVEMDDEMLKISVKDFGVGMDEKTESAMFETGLHPKDFSTSNKSGAGLGLMICKRLANSIDAEISVESELNVGTTFTILLPQPNSKEKVYVEK